MGIPLYTCKLVDAAARMGRASCVAAALIHLALDNALQVQSCHIMTLWLPNTTQTIEIAAKHLRGSLKGRTAACERKHPAAAAAAADGTQLPACYRTTAAEAANEPAADP